MPYNLPYKISDEKDLNIIEERLLNDKSKYKNNSFLEILGSYLEKPIKIELIIGNRLNTRIGKLCEVGQDFVILKNINYGFKTVIPLNFIRIITLLQGN